MSLGLSVYVVIFINDQFSHSFMQFFTISQTGAQLRFLLFSLYLASQTNLGLAKSEVETQAAFGQINSKEISELQTIYNVISAKKYLLLACRDSVYGFSTPGCQSVNLKKNKVVQTQKQVSQTAFLVAKTGNKLVTHCWSVE